LEYAYKDMLGWHFERVGPGEGPSLALDGDGHPHVGYHRQGPLRYAYRDASGWHTETVGSTDWVGGSTSLALDGSGYPHISYQWLGWDWVAAYAYRDASGWHDTDWMVDFQGEYTSLAIDASGYPRISYYDCNYNTCDLNYACPTIALSGTVQAEQLVLTWTALRGTSEYWVYGADNEAHFEPGFAPGYQHRLAVLSPLFQTWSSPNGVSDPGHNWAYMVLAVGASEQELCRSNRFGECDFSSSTEP
jgi:hypothetical protein